MAIALAMVLSFVPALNLHAHAAGTLTLGVTGLSASWTDASNSKGSATWSGSDNSITGNAKGYTQVIGRTITTTLTLKNNLDSAAQLSFDYSITAGSVAANAGTMSGGKFSYDIPAGGSVTITQTSPRGSSTGILSITNIALVVAGQTVDATFLPADEGGSYTVTDAAGTVHSVTVSTTLTQEATQNYTLTATADSGYTFLGWYSAAKDSYLSYEATTTQKFGEDPQLKPVFVSATVALFGVGSVKFADLTEAGEYAVSVGASQINLLNSGTVSGEHTIPAGVTLLVPFDDAYTCYTDKPENIGLSGIAYVTATPNAWQTPYAFRTLSLASDAKITVNGAISVSAKHSMGNGSGQETAGSPSGACGWVNMTAGSEIILESDANLYAWGYIVGDGEITAKSGSTVYENIQFTDFRGGTATSAMATAYQAFPMSQYYVQNIEVLTRYNAGASEYVYCSIFMSKNDFSASVKFMGEGGMFSSTDGYVTKDYIEATDRLEVTTYGTSTMSGLSMGISSVTIDSSDFVLPINSNIDITIASGTTTVNQSICMLPGSTLTVDQGATLKLANTPITSTEEGLGVAYSGAHNLIVYDADNWTWGLDLSDESLSTTVTGNFVHAGKRLRPVKFSAANGTTVKRTESSLVDVVFDINGTVITEGYLYTTAGKDWTGNGASIISSEKTGKLVMNSGAGQDVLTLQANYTDAVVNLGIPMISAQLKNGDGSYTDTSAALAGDSFVYCADCDQWVKQVTVTFDANGGSGAMAQQTVNACEHGKLNLNAFTNGNKYFTGWNTAADGKGDAYGNGATAAALTGNVTLYAQWSSGMSQITWIIDGNDFTSDQAYGQAPVCPVTPTKNGDGKHVTYTFKGWKLPNTADTEILSSLPIVEGDAAYEAVFEANTSPCVDDNKDHACDVCGATMGTHTDADKDHACDYGCSEAIGTCEDTNKDHACDYGCGKSYGTCADTDKDHACDYGCDKVYGTCEDANKDHACDYGCGKVYGTCEDTNKDHACDYGCGKVYGTCEDTNKDHTCDYGCGKVYGTCEDANKDHACDYGCGKVYGTCADTDKDHTCDYGCGKSYGTCEDANKDHACDYGCGKSYGTCEDTNKDHTCDYGCGKSYGEHVQAEGKHTCDYCNQVMSQCKDENPKDHNCDICGEKLSDCSDAENDGDHKCDTCGAEDITAHIGGTATCCVPAICTECSQPYGEKDMTNHIDPGVRVEANSDKTHSYYHECCDVLKETVNCVAGANSHNCGTCNNVLSDHEDTDKDHECDTCGANMGVHADAENDGDHLCDYGCGETIGDHTGGEADCSKQAVCTECKTPYGPLDGDKHVQALAYKDVTDAKHTAYYPCCNKSVETVDHSYTDGVCVCGHVQKFTITWKNEDGSVITTTTVEYGKLPVFNGTEPTKAATAEYTFAFAGWGTIAVAKEDAVYTASFTATPRSYQITFAIPYVNSNGEPDERLEVLTVPFGANLSEYLPELPEKLAVNNLDLYQGVFTVYGWDLEEVTMPAYNMGTVRANMNYTGWVRGEGPAVYVKDMEQVFGTWIILGEDFLPAETGTAYYLDENGFVVTGIVRVPYPTKPINGITYGPDAEDAANGDKYGYTDAETGLFVFDENGAFLQNLNGLYGSNWAVNGQLPWHVGLVQNGSDYYYFVGENEMATGNVYVSRNTTQLNVTIGGVYTFGADGKLCKYHGITEVNGTLYYYDSYQLMMGAGLIHVDGDYYYVRSNGALVCGKSYWVANTNGHDVEIGQYEFADDGKMIIPEVVIKADGIYFEDGKWVYYVGGKIGYDKGLIETDLNWYGANGQVVRTGGKIYVRSNGQLATGNYYVTNLSNYEGDIESGSLVVFTEQGIMENIKHGFVEEDGVVMYYQNNKIVYGAGLIKIGEDYYYVCSDGHVVMGQKYWITNVNATGIESGMYEFDAEGKLILPETYGVTGIVDGVYYVDGHIAYGAGLVEYNGGYIYARSNGQVATGKYWVTNHNDLKEPGMYTFDSNGMLIEE